MKRLVVLLGFSLMTASWVQAQSKPVPPVGVQGVWRVTEITTTGPGGTTSRQSQPGLMILTGSHFSIVRVNSEKPRPSLSAAEESKASTAELLAVYGNAFTAMAGTYELTGDRLTTRAMVATRNGPMSPGSFQTFSFALDGSTLVLTNVETNQGPVANPTTWKLVRLE